MVGEFINGNSYLLTVHTGAGASIIKLYYKTYYNVTRIPVVTNYQIYVPK